MAHRRKPAPRPRASAFGRVWSARFPSLTLYRDSHPVKRRTQARRVRSSDDGVWDRERSGVSGWRLGRRGFRHTRLSTRCSTLYSVLCTLYSVLCTLPLQVGLTVLGRPPAWGLASSRAAMTCLTSCRRTTHPRTSRDAGPCRRAPRAASLPVHLILGVGARDEVGDEVGDFLGVERVDQADGHRALGRTVDREDV